MIAANNTDNLYNLILIIYAFIFEITSIVSIFIVHFFFRETRLDEYE